MFATSGLVLVDEANIAVVNVIKPGMHEVTGAKANALLPKFRQIFAPLPVKGVCRRQSASWGRDIGWHYARQKPAQHTGEPRTYFRAAYQSTETSR